MESNNAIDFIRAKYGDNFPGVLVLWSKQTAESRFFAANELDDLSATIATLSEREDLYLALGTQAERLSPKQRGTGDTVAAIPGFVADIDFASAKDSAKNYPADRDEALRILSTFPHMPTAIIETGNGIHVHWDLTELFVAESLERRARAKRVLAAFQRKLIAHFRKHGCEIDNVGDLTRNYRLPGTLNHKSNPPKPVQLIEHHPERRYAFQTVERLVGDLADQEFDAEAPTWDQILPPADHDAIMRRCSWYREVVVEGAATCDEPDWYAGASITARCVNGDEIFHAYSRNHPKYAEREAGRKLERARTEAGPRTCEAIETHYPGCQTCPSRGKIASPIQLGRPDWREYDPGDEGPLPLGFTKEGLYALRDQVRNIVIQASANQLLSSQYLIGLAPSRFWAKRFPGKKGMFNFTRAGEALLRACREAGPFNPATVRGRGIWLEGQRVVVNLGGPTPEEVKHTYLCFEPIELGANQTFDGQRLLDLLGLFRWRNPQDAMLLVGWLAIAPICGALKWRPHCFVYGPPRCGKTTIHLLAASLLQPLVVSADGQSSEAGIRQTLGPDSLPIVIDEFESDQRATGLKGVIRLARSASSADNPVLRGTPEGRAMQFSLRTTFFFCAINPRGMSPADHSRILLLEMQMHDNDPEVARKIAHETVHFQNLEGQWCGYMVSQAHLVPDALAQFEPAIPSGDARHRRNIATLLGGAFVALHGRAPSEQETKAWASEYAATVALHAQDIERDDALECLDHLFSQVVQDVPVGSLLAEALRKTRHNRPGHEHAQLAVRGLGMVIRREGEHAGLYIRNGSPGVEKLFKDTVWADRAWERALKKLDGAELPKGPVYFPDFGQKARCVRIPLSFIPPFDEGAGTSDEDD